MTTFDLALAIAREVHAGQVDKAGRPVIEHVLRVVDAVEGEDAEVVAALHDVLEDSPEWTGLAMLDRGIPYARVRDVHMLTRGRDEPYSTYISRVTRASATARSVKIADLRDHLHPDRVGAITPSHAERYRRALRQLGADGGDHGGR